MVPHLPEKDAFSLAEIADYFGVPVDTVLNWARQKLIACCVWLKKQKADCYSPFRRRRPNEDKVDAMWVAHIEGLYRIPASQIADLIVDGSCAVTLVYPESTDYTVHSMECYLFTPVADVPQDR